MPAKDKYHDNVIHALEKDGWQVVSDPMTLFIPSQHLYIDLRIEKESETALVEIKVFDGYPSPVDYLGKALGQYLLYQEMLKLMRWSVPVYLAVPQIAYENVLSQALASNALKRLNSKLIVYEPVAEEIVQWIR